jgi:uncharacterized iron-regulated membrane protein
MLIASLLVLHRYLGVLLGVLMTLWCLSGFVMMYQGFPETTLKEREAGLAPLELAGCCALDRMPLADDAPVRSFRIEALNGAPVLRIATEEGRKVFHLKDGTALEPLGAGDVSAVAAAFARGAGIAGAPVKAEPIRVDQWSVSFWRREAPVWRVRFDDPGSSYVYLNGATGEVTQDARPAERFWSWLGAIPHWLYPTLLRENQPLWYQVCIWGALLGVFLTVTGIVVGVVKLRGKSGRYFPYRRRMWWLHHVLGVFAGLLVLTWTFSGLLTMQPWGLLESEPAVTRADITGRPSWGETREAIAAALGEAREGAAKGGDVVSIRSAPFLGEPHAVLALRDGSEMRVGRWGIEPVTAHAAASLIQAAGGPFAGARLDVLEREDAYYYGHKAPVELPVLRLTFADAEATRAYLDIGTGEVLRVADGTAQRYRWFENAFHNFDWPALKARPVWDLVVLPLLLAVTFVCATGTWLSFTRIGRDAGRLREAMKRAGKGLDPPAGRGEPAAES